MFRVVLVSCFLMQGLLIPVELQAEDKSQIEEGNAKDANVDGATESYGKSALRYFSSNKDYRPEDLIVQSQVAEFQNYLKRTKGHSAATHPRLVKRVLPDHSPLSKLFHQKRFKQTLRDLSKQLNGYASLYKICSTAAGRKELETLLKKGDTERIAVLAAEAAKKPMRRQASKIFTIGDLLAATRPSSKVKAGSKDSSEKKPEAQIK